MQKALRLIVLGLLLLLALPLAAFAQDFTVEDAEAIAIGDIVEGELTQAAPTVAYTFEATEGQVISISLLSEDFDCFLTLLDAEGNELATDDDGAGNLDSEIAGFSIPADGSYIVLAQSYGSANGNNGETGEYTLEIRKAAGSTLEYGMTIEDELTSRDLSKFYTFTGDEGDTILITMISDGGWDTYLNLYEGTDTSFPLISNDDGAGNLNSLIGPYTLPSSGIYTIEATSFNRGTEGAFSLSLERAEVTTLEYGDSVEATLDNDDSFAYFQFEGEAGELVDITIEDGADVGVAVVLNGPDGFQVGYADSYSGEDPVINDLALSSSGVYTILIRVLEPGSEGKVNVILEEAELASLDDDSATLEFSSSITRNTLSFTGEAGETVTLTLTVDGDSASPTVTVTQDGITVSYISASTVTELVVTFEVPADGVVIVQIDEYSYDDRTIEVSLDR
ncbi:MAG: PPC domain-containing protein [Chloroflexota bacterium]|nr:PPC domain-containing protein [Chloroflexota bacterium]